VAENYILIAALGEPMVVQTTEANRLPLEPALFTVTVADTTLPFVC
jgi:hypothetical protein